MNVTDWILLISAVVAGVGTIIGAIVTATLKIIAAISEMRAQQKLAIADVKKDNTQQTQRILNSAALGDTHKNQKLDKIITLTNGKNTAALLKAAVALRRVADRFGSPEDVQAALDAEREYKDSAAADAMTHAVVAGHDSGIIR